MTWYRTYRSRQIADLHLQKVRETLQELMAQGRLPQVMLFAGPKGTGKTSTARIIGALLNDPINETAVRNIYFKKSTAQSQPLQEPTRDLESLAKIYEGNSYLVQELDAASNRGIDDVRALRERVALPPQEGLMSVYILDEAHMLTTEAFNALLKLLEEPPPHAVFILATTELHKIPATIVSRSTVIPFTKATTNELTTALNQVIKQEKLTAEPAAIEQIALFADGSFRDAIKTLELVASRGDDLTEAVVAKQLTGNSHQQIESLITAVVNKDAPGVVTVFESLRQAQADQSYFFRQLCLSLHQALLQAVGVKPGTPAIKLAVAQFLLTELQQINLNQATPIPFLAIELKLLEVVSRAKNKASKGDVPPPAETPEVKKKPVEINEEPVSPVNVSQLLSLNEVPLTAKTDVVESPLTNFVSPVAPDLKLVSDNLQDLPEGDGAKLLEQWDVFIGLMTQKNSSVAALLRSAKPISSDKGKATVAVFYKFHKEQLQQPKFQKMIDDCMGPVAGGKVRIEFILAETPAAVDEKNTPGLTALAEELLV